MISVNSSLWDVEASALEPSDRMTQEQALASDWLGLKRESKRTVAPRSWINSPRTSPDSKAVDAPPAPSDNLKGSAPDATELPS